MTALLHGDRVFPPGGGQPEPLTFGVSGKLIMNVLVMYDRQTGSYWSQILGEARGRGTGRRDTQAAGRLADQLGGVEGAASRHAGAATRAAAARTTATTATTPSDVAGVIGETRSDERLNRKALGLGMVIDERRASSRFHDAAQRAASSTTASVAWTWWWPTIPTRSPGGAFDRTVDGQTLTFCC